MNQVKRPYGHWSCDMMAQLRERGVLKVEAFIHWLANQDICVDRTLVSHWVAGRSHLPADLLPLLADFTGHPEFVFGPYLKELHCDVVHLPRSQASSQELVDLVLAAGATLGELQQALVQARLPDSPCGEAISTDERDRLLQHLEELLHRLAELRAKLQCSKPLSPRGV